MMVATKATEALLSELETGAVSRDQVQACAERIESKAGEAPTVAVVMACLHPKPGIVWLYSSVTILD